MKVQVPVIDTVSRKPIVLLTKKSQQIACISNVDVVW